MGFLTLAPGTPGKNTGVVCHALLQGTFVTQGSNPVLPHCRQILYRLSHQGRPSLKKEIFNYWAEMIPTDTEKEDAVVFSLEHSPSTLVLNGVRVIDFLWNV